MAVRNNEPSSGIGGRTRVAAGGGARPVACRRPVACGAQAQGKPCCFAPRVVRSGVQAAVLSSVCFICQRAPPNGPMPDSQVSPHRKGKRSANKFIRFVPVVAQCSKCQRVFQQHSMPSKCEEEDCPAFTLRARPET